MDYLLLLLGFAALIIGGNYLVKGAVGIAVKAGISSLTIGMTVVSFGTSAPELLVSLQAALQVGESSLISVGNVVGSNIANISLVLGFTALIAPVVSNRTSIVQDWPVMMFSTLICAYFMADLEIDRSEGIVLFTLLLLFMAYLFYKSRKDQTDDQAKEEVEAVNPPSSLMLNVFYILIGVAGLTFGSEWLVQSATSIAISFGVSPFVIGVTIVAFGTSVPELATSAIAAYKKQSDLAVGNLIGSNIFNILAVLGITAMITPVPLTQSIFDSDVLWMVLVAVLLLAIMLLRGPVSRWKGLLLLLFYVAYVYFLLGRQVV